MTFIRKAYKTLFGRRGNVPPSTLADAYEAQHGSPLEALPILRRTLTQPGSPSTSESRLLTLPSEIRAMIWYYTVGGQRIALYRKDGRLTFCVLDERHCRTPGRLHTASPGAVQEEIIWITGVAPQQSLTDQPTDPRQLLAPMMTCRRMYMEMIEQLYSSNLFMFLQNSALEDLQATILPHRFSAIRSIHIHYQIPELAYAVHRRNGPRGDRRRMGDILRPLWYMQPIENMSIFVQGPLKRASWCKAELDHIEGISYQVTGSLVVRMPWPILDGYFNDSESEGVSKTFTDSPIRILSPPWKPNAEGADLQMGYDVGWRVGAMFLPVQDGSEDIEITSYAIFTPVPAAH